MKIYVPFFSSEMINGGWPSFVPFGSGSRAFSNLDDAKDCLKKVIIDTYDEWIPVEFFFEEFEDGTIIWKDDNAYAIQVLELN